MYEPVKKGDKLPEQWKENARQARIKYYQSHAAMNKGVPHTKNTRKKMSRAMKTFWKKRKVRNQNSTN